MERKYIVGIVILIIVIGGAFLYANKVMKEKESHNETEYLQVSQNGVSIIVPGNWVKATSESNSSLLAVADPSSKNANGFSDISVNIERKNITDSLDAEFTRNYDTLSVTTGYQVLFSGNVSGIGGYSGLEADYISNLTGVAKQHKAIWIEKDGFAYVILCTAPQSSFNSKEMIFNQIIGNFKFN